MSYRSWVLAVALSASLLGCGKSSKVCEEAVHHMALGIIPPGESYPRGEELAVIKTLIKMGSKECTKEGLSREQADCILAYQPFAEGSSMATAMTTLSECPAIAQKRPSWLSLPAPEGLALLRGAEEERRMRDNPPDAGAADLQPSP